MSQDTTADKTRFGKSKECPHCGKDLTNSPYKHLCAFCGEPLKKGSWFSQLMYNSVHPGNVYDTRKRK